MLGYIDKQGQILVAKGDLTHPEFNKTLNFNCYNPRDVVRKEGYIRLNDGARLLYECLAELPGFEITDEQYKSLVDWLYIVMRYRHQVEIEIGVDENNIQLILSDKTKNNPDIVSFWKVYSFDNYFPEDIIKEIKKYYNEQKYKNKKS